MVSRRELYNHVKKELGSDFEARQLCTAIIGEPDGNADKAQAERLMEMCQRRKNGYPLQYLLGEWDFFSRRFFVGEGVLIPRQDTETIVEAAIEIPCESPVIIDLCSGSGCIGITLGKEIEGSKVYAAEKSEKALEYLLKNKELNSSDITAVCCDVLDVSSTELFPVADMIVCNPPYLTADDMDKLQTEVGYEPSEALFGGEDGLTFYREVTSIWRNKLRCGGTIIYEIGLGQENDVEKILLCQGFENIRFRKDLCNIIRAVIAEKK